MLSSLVKGDIEYAPGRSTAISCSFPANFALMGCSFLSTVTPAQFPTFSLRPVRALNIVVLPELGLPVKAILIGCPPILILTDIIYCVDISVSDC